MNVFSIALRDSTIPLGSPASEVSSSAGLLSLLAFMEEAVFSPVVAFFLDAHGSNIRHVYLVRKVGLEPTCDQLPFLQGISLRGYLRLCVPSFKGLLSVTVGAPNLALPNLPLYCVYAIGLINHICYVVRLLTADMIKL